MQIREGDSGGDFLAGIVAVTMGPASATRALREKAVSLGARPPLAAAC